jgi:hypothetical protein
MLRDENEPYDAAWFIGDDFMDCDACEELRVGRQQVVNGLGAVMSFRDRGSGSSLPNLVFTARQDCDQTAATTQSTKARMRHVQ